MTRMDEVTAGIQKVGVIGMGTMGAGIVQNCLMSGYPVVAWDDDEVAASSAGQDKLSDFVVRSILTVDNFMHFRNMMVQRNLDLTRQALAQLEAGSGGGTSCGGVGCSGAPISISTVDVGLSGFGEDGSFGAQEAVDDLPRGLRVRPCALFFLR